MEIRQPSLVQFETARRQYGFIPPGGSNSYFDVGSGRIDLKTLRDNPNDYRFDLTIDHGKVYTGAGNFIVAGETLNSETPYRNLIVALETELTINQFLTVQGGELEAYGTIELLPHSQLRIYGGDAVLHPSSVLIINDKTNLSVAPESTLTIYGRVDVHISVIDSILNVPGIIIDSAAVMNVDGIVGDTTRPYSLTDYDAELRDRFINVNTQGDKNLPDGRLGFIWRRGSPKEPSQVLGVRLQLGDHPLGDFRLPILGLPEKTSPQMQTLSDLHIRKGTSLHVTESFNGHRFIRPELYLGGIIDNTQQPADCLIEGRLIVDGSNSMVTMDRGGTLRIAEGGEFFLQNGALLRSTHNNGIEVLKIDGRMTIDTIEQIETLSHENISFGHNGRLIILNPPSEEKRLLFTTPNGILSSTLYRLFRDRIDSVEYHVSENCGIGIDQYYDNYSKEMTKWYGDRRFEKAIHDGILKWHRGAYMELYTHITPSIDENSTLLSIGPLFKTFGSYESDRLQDLVDRLRYAGCNDILFRFINGEKLREVTLVVEECLMKRILNNPIGMKYILQTTNSGELFLRNRISNTEIETLLHPISRRYEVPTEKIVEFTLP